MSDDTDVRQNEKPNFSTRRLPIRFPTRFILLILPQGVSIGYADNTTVAYTTSCMEWILISHYAALMFFGLSENIIIIK